MDWEHLPGYEPLVRATSAPRRSVAGTVAPGQVRCTLAPARGEWFLAGRQATPRRCRSRSDRRSPPPRTGRVVGGYLRSGDWPRPPERAAWETPPPSGRCARRFAADPRAGEWPRGAERAEPGSRLHPRSWSEPWRPDE